MIGVQTHIWRFLMNDRKGKWGSVFSQVQNRTRTRKNERKLETLCIRDVWSIINHEVWGAREFSFFWFQGWKKRVWWGAPWSQKSLVAARNIYRREWSDFGSFQSHILSLDLINFSQTNLQKPSPIWSFLISMAYKTTGLRKQNDFDKIFIPYKLQIFHLPGSGWWW